METTDLARQRTPKKVKYEIFKRVGVLYYLAVSMMLIMLFYWQITDQEFAIMFHRATIAKYASIIPTSTNDGQSKENGFFNLTMTYRKDSDIRKFYGALEPMTRTDQYSTTTPVPYDDNELVKRVAGKTKLVVQFVSNCANSPSQRQLYVKELKRYATVDVFGACGVKKCSRQNESVCDRMVGDEYYFYLSFENSVCKDYVTEKFFRPLKAGTVPVVLRKKDYAFAPEGSFIAADQFESPIHLASYLLSVASNRTRYLEYFAWRKRYWKEFIGPNTGLTWSCDLCMLLHKNTNNHQHHLKHSSSYDDIEDWWKKQADCQDKFSSRFLLKRNSSPAT